ncbi:MAG TPA: phage terminase large subunit [Allocoleopsis sp.]
MSFAFDEYTLTADVCRTSFYQFFIEFWSEVVHEPLELNWHIKYLCDQMQRCAERVFRGEPKKYDVICNVPPGTSKSSIVSIMFPAWMLCRMPNARMICVSHATELALDLSRKCRDVVRSEKYQKCFGVERMWNGQKARPVIINEDQDTKGYWATTEGGFRIYATIGGRVPIGFHAHCFPYETPITTDRGDLPIGRIVEEKLNVKVLGYDHESNSVVWQSIEQYMKNPGQPLYRVCFSDGTELETTEDHPFYVKGKGYVSAVDLLPNDEIIHENEINSDLYEVQEGIFTREIPSTTKRKDILHSTLLGFMERRKQSQSSVCEDRMYSLSKRNSEKNTLIEEIEERSILWTALPRNMAREEQLWTSSLSIQGRDSCLRNLWQRNKSKAFRPKEILQQEMQGGMVGRRNKRGEAFKICKFRKTMRNLWGFIFGIGIKQEQKVLQQSLQNKRDQRKEECSLCKKDRSRMWLVWRHFVEKALCKFKRGLLFSGMQEQSPFQKNERKRKPKLYSWDSRSIQFGFQWQITNEDKETRKEQVFYLRQEAKRKKVGCASHRLEQIQQQENQSSSSVSQMSYEFAGEEKETKERCKTVVVSVERTLRIPRSVYNIQTNLNHNYFAKKILVHNCQLVDDPIDPKKVASEFELKEANRWMNEVLPSRKVDKRVTFMALIMQRLHQDDPTGNRLENKKGGKLKHICLPAELRDNVKPEKLKRYYKEGLLDPIRLPLSVLEEQQGILGDFAYAGQYDQNPVPFSGGLFRFEKLNFETPPANAVFKRIVRAWDTASGVKDYHAFTAGVKMGVTKDNRFWVLDVVRGRWRSEQREGIILQTARMDGKSVKIILEQQGGSSGLDVVRDTIRMLAGFHVAADKPTGEKHVRAVPFSVQVNYGNVYLPLGAPWVQDYVAEMRYFPNSKFKDQVDASSMAFSHLTKHRVVGGLKGF